MSNYAAKLNGYVEMIDKSLTDYIADTGESIVNEAMAYSVLNGGKRIRGAMLLAAYEMFSADKKIEKALPFAAALEMIHAYSLIHDDLPCMDDDDMRRGKPSCHIAFGEAIAVLAGDGLLTLAFEICTDQMNLNSFDAQTILSTANTLAVSAGTSGMIGGQVMDIQGEGKELNADYLHRMDNMKTGALISVAVRLGCILAGASQTSTSALVRYALDLGIAFQIRDDILDKTADAEALGKPIGSDDKNKKSTYTGLYGLDGAKAEAAKFSGSAKSALENIGTDAGFFLWLADYLLERGS